MTPHCNAGWEKHRLRFRLYRQSPSAECQPGERSREITLIPPLKGSAGACDEDEGLKTPASFLMLKSFKTAGSARLILACISSLSQAVHSDCKKLPARCVQVQSSTWAHVVSLQSPTVFPQEWASQLCCRAPTESQEEHVHSVHAGTATLGSWRALFWF